MGWLFDAPGQAEHARYARDLSRTAACASINRLFLLWVVASASLIPAALGYAIDGTLAGALTGALWGGAVRIFLLHHVTWSINSVCHFFGTRRFDVEDHSTNVFWLALLSFGESWHHNHHAFPRSARARPALVGGRPDRLGDPRDEGREAGLERGRDQPGAPGSRSSPRGPRTPVATRRNGRSAVPPPRAAPDNP